MHSFYFHSGITGS